MLREAARLMRAGVKELEGSDYITPWRAMPMPNPDNDGWLVANGLEDADYDNTVARCEFDFTGPASRYIASMHPAVALGVADCLDAAAGMWPPDPHEPREGCPDCSWIAVARAYLGDPP